LKMEFKIIQRAWAARNLGEKKKVSPQKRGRSVKNGRKLTKCEGRGM